MRGSPVLILGASLAAMASPDFTRRFDNEVTKVALYGPDIASVRLSVHTKKFDAVVKEIRAQGPEMAARVDSALKRAHEIASGRGEQVRFDAFSASAGLHMARQLEHIYSEVLREPFPVQNAMTLFPMDTSVPPGAKTHTVRRVYQDGEVAVYRGGTTPIPRVGVSQQERTFPIRHYVTSFVYSLFEQLSSAFANTGLVAELLRTARDLMQEFLNQKTWYGDEVNGIYGVLNYPWLSKKVVATPFDGSADPDDVIAELNALVNYPKRVSKATLKPDTLVTSIRVRDYLMNTRMGTVSDTTIGEYWLRTNSQGIKSIEEAWELEGVGPGGTDGMLAYRKDRLGVVNVVPQSFTTLPVQSLGFEDTTFAYMSHGGILMRDVGNNILGWIDPGT